MNGFSCAGPLLGGTGVNYHEARSVIPGFCAATAGNTIDAFTNQTGNLKTASGNSDILLTISYTTTRQTYDTSCSLDPGASITISAATCEQAFYRLLDDCDTPAPDNLGKFGGVATSGCGVYTLATQPEEIVACGNNPYPRSIEMPWHAMTNGMEDYCNTPLELTPDYVVSDKFLVDVPKGQSLSNYLEGSVVVKTVTQFNDQGQTGCSESKAFSTNGDECKRKLTSIIDQCGGKGGVLSENGKNGCVLWTIWGQRAT